MSANYVMPYLSEFFMLSSAVCMAIGWVQIRRRNVRLHRRMMLLSTFFALAFFVNYVSKSLIIGDTSFGGPDAIRGPYLLFLVFHILLATFGAIIGFITLRRALRGRFSLHRRIAPFTAVIWFITTATGLVVFLLLYVIYPPGPTVPFWQYFG